MRFSKVVALAFVGLVSSFSAHATQALEQAWEAGKHYEVLPIAVQTSDATTVEVVEVFSYACIHCFSFDPDLNKWRSNAPAGVKFLRIPAVFNADWQLMAQAYFTAEVLDVVDKVHEHLFNAIHVESRDLRDPAVMAEVFEKYAGIEPDQFNEVYNSFSVRNRVNQAVAKGRAYKITGVPTLIVNGKYRVDGQMAGDNTRMLEVVDFLIAKERLSTGDNAKAVTH
jgi:protein dithiol oxidoreductase (disulfide-forming)